MTRKNIETLKYLKPIMKKQVKTEGLNYRVAMAEVFLVCNTRISWTKIKLLNKCKIWFLQQYTDINDGC
jgi:hypothetical protein